MCRHFLDEIDHLDRLITTLDERITSLTKDHDQDLNNLDTIPGIGRRAAEINRPERQATEYMYNTCMAVALQIRNVPDEVRDALVERASQLGQSMQAFLLDVIQREARIARNAQAFERTAGHRTVIPDEFNPERIIREGRDAGFDIDRDNASGLP